MSDITSLAASHCTPRVGSGHQIKPERARALLDQLPGWSSADGGKAIMKTFKFDDYHQTMAVVNALAWIAHREDHHPDLGVFYDHVDVTFTTHDVNGLSENDFICAAKVQALFE